MKPKSFKQQKLDISGIGAQLKFLKLAFMADHHADLAKQAGREEWSHLHYLTTLVEGEWDQRQDRATKRRIKDARFPVIKTLDQFQWNWPEKINRPLVQSLFTMDFVKKKANIIFLGGVGLGKTHLATALAYQACVQGAQVLFTTAIDVINHLATAQQNGKFQQDLKKYIKPALLVLDELGYLPIDKRGADLLFQVISHRYERGAMIISTNRAFKDWPEIFNQDAMLTSAILDRLLHHAQTVLIEGPSYRMKEKIDS